MKRRMKALAVGTVATATLVGIPALNTTSFSSAAPSAAMEEGKTMMVTDSEVDLAAVPALAVYGTFYLSATGWQQVGWVARQAGLGSLARDVIGGVWKAGSDYNQHDSEADDNVDNLEIVFDR